MKIIIPFAVRDLYCDELRTALEPVKVLNATDGDIVAAARPIAYVPDEQVFDHRYSGDFYQIKANTLWPLSVSTIKRVWKEQALKIGQKIRDCEKLRWRTGVSVLLARDRGLDVTEATLFCTSAGVVWRIEGPSLNSELEGDDEIEAAVRLLYGGYIDEPAHLANPRQSAWELGRLLSALIYLDAYEIAGLAETEDCGELRLARRLRNIDFEVEAWLPD